MTNPDQAFVQRLIGPRESIITDLVLGAFARWWKNPERGQLYRRVQAGLIHNYTMNAAPTAFASDPGVRIVPGQETLSFVIEEILILRFKKGDASGLSRNIETLLALAWLNPQECIPGLPDLMKIEACYVLNKIQTQIDKILIVARNYKGMLWSYQIFPVAASVMAPPLPIPTPPQSSASNVVRLPRRKAAPKKEQG